MKTLIYCIIGIVLIIVVSYIFAFCLRKKQNDFYNKKGLVKIILIIVSPFLIYAVITLILILVRGNSFVGYYVESNTIYYDGTYYKEVTDEAKIEEINDYGDGYWTYTETFILSDEITFPYFEYWIPNLFFEQVVIPGDKDDVYIILKPMEGQIYFERQ